MTEIRFPAGHRKETYGEETYIEETYIEGTWKKGRHKKRSPGDSNVPRAPAERRRLPTLPHCIAVPSAQVGLTSLFGMGRGGTPPQ